MTEWATRSKEDERSEGLKGAWGQLVGAIEWELCGVADRFWEGLLDERYMGRREGLAYGWSQTLPPRISGKYGEVDPHMHALLWARNRLNELMHLARGKDSEENVGEQRAERRHRQWYRLISKVTSKGSPLTLTLAKEERWKRIGTLLKSFRHSPKEAITFLDTTCAWVDLVIKDENRIHIKGRRRGWEGWVAKSLKEGGGALHKWAKREKGGARDLHYE